MRLFILLPILPGFSYCYSQVDIINLSSSRKDSNVVFQDVTNQLSVVGPGMAHYQLKSGSATISQGGSSFIFNIETSRPGPDTFYLSRNGKVVLKPAGETSNPIPLPQRR